MVEYLQKNHKIYKSTHEIPTILYHGTNSSSIKELKSGIILGKGRRKSDFGQGFYLTANYKQARNWALSRTNILNKQGYVNEFAVVLIFGVNIKKLSSLKGHFFKGNDNDWASFVFRNRSGVYQSDDKGIVRYDFVYGPLADGRNISVLIKKVMQREMTIECFKNNIVGDRFPFPIDHQFAFNSNESIKHLSFIGFKEVD